MERSAGILMPITSLPSPYGVGAIGKQAYAFADFLKAAGQTYWQILPVGPTSYGDSPYQSFSTYAGNPYLIDLDLLAEQGLLQKRDYRDVDFGDDPQKVDYAKLYAARFDVLRKAFERFKRMDQTAFHRFQSQNAHWLENYALYMAVKKSFGMAAWTEWPDEDIRLRKPESVKRYRQELDEDVTYYMFLQYLFFDQWGKLRAYVNRQGIQLFGDMPIYVAMDSADTWANPEVFWLDEDRLPVRVAGCPPDYFSATGQLWGNPLYNWEYLKQTGYDWWIKRVRSAAQLFDITRIDHFRGFDEYYSIPYGAKDAVVGDWLPGPGVEFFKVLKEKLNDPPIIAEDLGLITPGVAKLLKEAGYPGMKVLQFAFDDRGESVYLPHLYTENYVVYTGTHDNDTTAGWFAAAAPGEKRFAKEYCRLSEEEGYTWGLIRTGHASVAKLFVAPMQDYLNLSSFARMNTPSTLGGNWQWRMLPGAATKELARRIKDLTQLYGRLNPNCQEAADPLLASLDALSLALYAKPLEKLDAGQLHMALGKAVMARLLPKWEQSQAQRASRRRAYYFSAEYLMGRMVFNNLYALGLLETAKDLLASRGVDLNQLEEIEDAALGNGGLGRLAACFLDSAATHGVPLDGYGIRYQYGLFKQRIQDGFQQEEADDWQRLGDPWSVRREQDSVQVAFSDQTVLAVPYDMAVIGAGSESVGTLRLWQAEPMQDFDFDAFNQMHYAEAVAGRDRAQDICRVLYPNDNERPGKILRLKQEYFFTSASLQDVLKRYRQAHGRDWSGFAAHCAIQLNDTHPVVAIPELIRLLEADGVDFETAFGVARDTFNYTNHTIMGEALEKWDAALFAQLLPQVYEVIQRIDARLVAELTQKGYDVPLEPEAEQAAPEDAEDEPDAQPAQTPQEAEADTAAEDTAEEDPEEAPAAPKKPRTKLDALRILDEGQVHMVRLAVYATGHTNGVARIHTEILKNDLLADWYQLYPQRFQNKTNGITQRRWLALCNPELAALITERIGDTWVRNLSAIREMQECLDDATVRRFNAVKEEKKRQLCAYIEKQEGVRLDPGFVFDIQAKRLHEYKRQLLNAFAILAIYRKLKRGEIADFTPTAFLFGAKAAPGYFRAKAIIKYIGEVAKLVNNDPDTRDLMQVLFVSNYNCSYAEKLIPAADISEQISTAGTEASGTGNMKFMLNGAVTLGTYDGANVEIVEQAGEENNYIFGARVEDIARVKEGYDPKALCARDPELAALVDSLVDGTFDDGGTGMFKELHTALFDGASWHQADHYFLLYDLNAYVEAKLKAIADTKDRLSFGRKCLRNIAGAGVFSSDRTIEQYAKEIWKL